MPNMEAAEPVEKIRRPRKVQGCDISVGAVYIALPLAEQASPAQVKTGFRSAA